MNPNDKIPRAVWIDAAVTKPTPIPIGDGSYCCKPEDSVICAIWCETDGETWLMCWAKQRYCEDGQWRADDKIGFEPTHWLPLPISPQALQNTALHRPRRNRAPLPTAP